MNDIQTICHDIDKANHHYYQLGHSLMTDGEYGTLFDKLRELDPHNHRLISVGSEPTLDKINHEYPMGSLDNIDINKPEELLSYIKRNSAIGDVSYHVTPKIDGSSIAIYYVNGKLDKVLTRGNGFVGQDITAKARFFKNVPLTLSQSIDIVVRGEAVMLREDFQKYIGITNTEGVKNSRNVGNGLIVRKDLMGAGLISFYAFGCFCDHLKFEGINDSYVFMKEIGLTTVNYIFSNEGGLKTAIDIVYSDRYPFDIDGVVVKIDKTQYRDIINLDGDELRPRSDRAIKFNSKKAETTVTGVNFTVGSTGRVTPTLMVEPVEIGGVVVSNVLVYNFDEIDRLNLGIGDKVCVVLSGDIIPKIVSVVDKRSDVRILSPTTCPSCSCLLTKKELKKGLSVDLYCINSECEAIKFERVKNFIGSSKRGMGILGIGSNLIDSLIKIGLLKAFSDLYKLKLSDIQNIKLGNGILGEKRAKVILENIEKSKSNSITKIIGSLGIDGFAESRIELIVKHADIKLSSLEDWSDENNLEYISNMKHHYLPSDVMVNGVKELRSMKNEMLELIKVGFNKENMQDVPKAEPTNTKTQFSNKKFCFTGTREFLKEVKDAGGIIKSDVTKDLDYLVQKDVNSTSSKSTKAKSFGIKIISVDQIKHSLENDTDL